MDTPLSAMPESIAPEQTSSAKISSAKISSAIVQNVFTTSKITAANKRQPQWKQVPLGLLRVGPGQPRQTCDPAALADLTQSIQAHGILQPILVRPIAATTETVTDAAKGNNTQPARYEIIAGKRRWQASQDAGLTQIPVLVQTLGDAAAAEVSLVENLQREDLTPLETAEALMQMMAQGYSVRRLAVQLSKQKGWVEQHLLLARLPGDLRAMVSGRPDTMTHAREIEKVTDLVLRAGLIAQVLDRDNPLPLARLRQIIKAAPNSEELVMRDTEDGAAAETSGDEGTNVSESMDAPVQKVMLNGTLSDATLPDATSAAPNEDECLPEAELGSEPEEETTLESVLHQEGLLANLRTAQKRLPQLPPPTDSRRRQELVQMLTATRDAISATLTRWEVQS